MPLFLYDLFKKKEPAEQKELQFSIGDNINLYLQQVNNSEDKDKIEKLRDRIVEFLLKDKELLQGFKDNPQRFSIGYAETSKKVLSKVADYLNTYLSEEVEQEFIAIDDETKEEENKGDNKKSLK